MKLSVRKNDIKASFDEFYVSDLTPSLLVSSFIDLCYIYWASIECIRLYWSCMAVVT